MFAVRPLIGLLVGLHSVSAFNVELKELVNPSLASATDSPFEGRDLSCAPDECKGILTRDGSQKAGSRYGCTQQNIGTFTSRCSVDYHLAEVRGRSDPLAVSSVHVAFTADSKTALRVLFDDEIIVDLWEGVEGSTKLQEIPGLEGYSVDHVELQAMIAEGEYVGITETIIQIEVDDVPVTGISASERISISASATINNDSAAKTIDGNTAASSAWSCSDSVICEITYDLQEVQSLQQVRIAFVEEASTKGAEFDLWTAGHDGVFSSSLQGVSASPRASSIEGLQTFGGIRKLARYVKIKGIPANAGEFSISEVEIRINEDAPLYPTARDPSLVRSGLLPLGADSGSSRGVAYDPRPRSEGGCSHGHLEGCHVHNIKDGINSPESRWSCSTAVEYYWRTTCLAQFDLNTRRYIRQIQLAFHKGDTRHNEFSIYVRIDGGWSIAIHSAISNGDTLDFQTWDLPAYTSAIRLVPKLSGVKDWISIKEMVLLEAKQGSKVTPILSFVNSETVYSVDTLPSSAISKNFSFDIDDVGSKVKVYIGGSIVWAVRMKFPADEVFTFDITYSTDDADVSTRFTSAGGRTKWENFRLPDRPVIGSISITAVEGPDIEDYPALRVQDCRVGGKHWTPGKKVVVSTTIEEWNVVPDYIGNGSGDQQEIMTAICDSIKEGFDGWDCDGVATGSPEETTVKMVMGKYYTDGPIFLKSGVDLIGRWSEDPPYETRLIMHGSPTGTDGIIVADNISGVVVEEVTVTSNLESSGPAGTVGNVCLDVKNSEDITIEQVSWNNCPLASARFVDTAGVTAKEFYDGTVDEGNQIILKGVTDYYLAGTSVKGMLIENSTDVLVESIRNDGEDQGSIEIPSGGDQTANLVVTGTTSGVTLKKISIFEGAEPRIVLENDNTFTIDEVTFSGGNSGDCVIEFPQGSDGNSVLVQLNVETELVLNGNCFELA